MTLSLEHILFENHFVEESSSHILIPSHTLILNSSDKTVITQIYAHYTNTYECSGVYRKMSVQNIPDYSFPEILQDSEKRIEKNDFEYIHGRGLEIDLTNPNKEKISEGYPIRHILVGTISDTRGFSVIVPVENYCSIEDIITRF